MIGAILGGVLGAVAGGQGTNTSGNTSSTSSVAMRDINDLNKGRSGLESAGDTASLDQFNQLLSLVNAGPGASAVTSGLNATNDYASMIQNVLGNGGMANSAQIGAANNYASQVFAPQRTALDQQFTDEGIQSQRMAAKLGRPGNDPIFANKMMQERTRQTRMLDSQQGSFASQYADQLPGRQLDLSRSLMDVRNGLANQAFNNRQTLLQLGQQLTNSERNYRMGTATKSSEGTSSQSQGGGLGGAIAGGLAGFGTGANPNVGKFFGDMGSSLSGLFTSTPKASAVAAGPAVGSSRMLSNQAF